MLLLLLCLVGISSSFSGGIEKIYCFDLTYTNELDPQDAYEHVHAVTAVAGLVNRDSPTLYLNYIDIDKYWLSYLQKDWLKDTNIITISKISDLFSTFSKFINGAVIYDPAVYSSSMIASTISGVENLIPICHRDSGNSLFTQFVTSGILKPKVNLVGLFNGTVTGSKKNDAYRWLLESKFMEKVNPLQVGYYLDYFWTTEPAKPYNMFTVTNQDFVIANRGLFFDLFFWDDEAPNDDPHQKLGTDLETAKLLFYKLNNMTSGEHTESLIQVNGFTPWRFKYTTGKHGGVETEWETVRILSSFNAFLDADACCIGSMTNSAFYQHYPLKSRYIQNPSPTRTDLISKGFIDISTGLPKEYLFFSFYVGDYDSSAWLYSQFINHWNDPARGSVPLGWAVNPTLSRRFPVIYPLIYSQRTANDYFTSGDSGAGYVNPTEYFSPRYSGLPAAENLWKKHCERYYNLFDLSYTGFIIQGRAGRMTDVSEKLYTSFSYDGAVLQENYQPSIDQPVHLQGNTPFFYEIDVSGDPNDVAKMIKGLRKSLKRQFFTFRGVLQSPSWFKKIVDAVADQTDIKVVTPIEMGYLGRIAMGGNNDNRITYLNDTIPRIVSMGKVYDNVEVNIRNEGWNKIEKSSGFFVKVERKEDDGGTENTEIGRLECSVLNVGSITNCVGSLKFEEVGEYVYGVYNGEENPFTKYGNIEWAFQVHVK